MSEYELEKFEESIRDKIYSVRGYQVMLDRVEVKLLENDQKFEVESRV
jgi:hypothetical protein